ncbi:agmatinase family protein [Alkalicaulis satelles]|uniref:Agmatinase family protein n=1 Tax=Alkalicaulis satelles TaxID=2609175 RepID=A0A5M6ZM67_9PROT|nr:agmatinase family protein [Alkalicaulis satelles]KAA5803361.1 agmatinase family protein [Alkalicaulis satelles]
MTADAPQSECRSWRSIADLLGHHPQARAALMGAPLAEGSLTPGRCDLAPGLIRETLKRFSVYDLETGTDLAALAVHDAGDVNLKCVRPADAFEPVRALAANLAERHELVMMLGGNNAVTRPGVHALGDLQATGLITLDAHFDLRDTDCGLVNGNPVRALLEDSLPGENIVQIGLAPFANTRRMHETAKNAGITVHAMSDVRARGVGAIVAEALDQLSARCAHIVVDFDIDVIDRSQCPGAPGARPGGMAVNDFFAAARQIAAHPGVRLVDLTEFDPSLDVSSITALTAGRWACEILAGLSARPA